MDNVEHRVVTKFLVKIILTSIEIFNEMKNMLDDSASSYTAVK